MRHTTLIVALLVANATTALADTAEIAAQTFQAADTNADQRLSYTEFAVFVDLGAAAGLGRLPQISARGLHQRAFDRLDQNGDQLITPEEMQAAAP